MSDPGDKIKEVVLASEEVQRRNINACIDHANTTRKMVRSLEEQVNMLQGLILEQKQTINSFNVRIAHLQQELVRGGSV